MTVYWCPKCAKDLSELGEDSRVVSERIIYHYCRGCGRLWKQEQDQLGKKPFNLTEVLPSEAEHIIARIREGLASTLTSERRQENQC